MASANYRYVNQNLNKTLQPTGVRCFSVGMAAEEQPMRAYVQKLKVSVIPKPSAVGIATTASFLVYASSSGSFSDQDIITAQAVPRGGGTVWLSVKRTIKDDDFKDDRNDGKVALWIRSSDSATTADIVCEAWGRFIDLDLN